MMTVIFHQTHLSLFCCFGRNCKRKFSRKCTQTVQYSEAKFFYGFQIKMENIHSETYSSIDTMSKTRQKKQNYLKRLKFSSHQRKPIGLCVGLIPTPLPRGYCFCCGRGHFLLWCVLFGYSGLKKEV